MALCQTNRRETLAAMENIEKIFVLTREEGSLVWETVFQFET